jgi:hypothetical protein
MFSEERPAAEILLDDHQERYDDQDEDDLSIKRGQGVPGSSEFVS